MQAERWRRVADLFEAAQQIPAADRAEFLKANEADSDLLAEVESMLKAADTGDPFLDHAPFSSIAERPEALKPGERLGAFEIVCLLGRGGMGEVYRARDTRLDRAVAIKILLPAFADDAGRLTRFEREARTASALNHPNIVSVHDVSREGGVSFIVTELVDGETLQTAIGRNPLPAARVVDIGRQIADGLAAAHAAGIVHRDLKPSNIMVRRDGRVTILDFGLARRQRPGAESVTLTGSGMLLGTVAYMSREQVRGQAIDARSDIFSFGVVLYEMLSGIRAFVGPTSVEVMHAILTSEPAELPYSVPHELAQIVRRCLEKEPARRFQSAADLSFALSASQTKPKSIGRPLKKPLIWATAAIVSAMLALAAWFSRPSPVPRVTVTVQVTNDGREKQWLLTDGARLLFHSAASQVWQVSVKGGPSFPISMNGKNAVADISPDHTELLQCAWAGYTQAGDPVAELWISPVVGGLSRRLGNVLTEAINLFCQAAWSPDGREIAYGIGGELHTIGEDGTGDHRIASVPGRFTSIRWSPDGRKIRCSTQTKDAAPGVLWDIPIAGEPVRLLSGWDACCGNWTPDGKYYVFAAKNGGGSGIWALRETGGWLPWSRSDPVPLTFPPLDGSWPLASTDGKRIFFIGKVVRNELVEYDSKSGRITPAFPGFSATELDYSKDGKWIVYVSVPESALWRCASDGTQCVQLGSAPLRASMPRWSPDGRTIAFMGARDREPWRIYLIPFEGGTPEQITHGEGGDRDPTWSPDGMSLVFSEAASSDSRVYRIDLSSKRIAALPGTEHMQSARWSPDSKLLAGTPPYMRPGVLLYDFSTQRQTLIPSEPALYPVWSQDGQFLFFRTGAAYSNSLFRIRVPNGKPERLLDMTKERLGYELGWFTVTPAGQVLMPRAIGTQEIYAVDWQVPK
jgi:serine/threonine protein kinase/Tol biopolymer transport system component